MKTFLAFLALTLFWNPPAFAGDRTRVSMVVNARNTEGSKVKNFRKCHEIQASGSAQFSQSGLEHILDRLRDKKVVLIDLREESHGFINGMAVSWKDNRNWANMGKTLVEIQQDEKERLSHASNTKLAKARTRSRSTQLSKSYDVLHALTEGELAEEYGITYLRIPVQDHCRPSDDEVNDFIQFTKSLSNESWLHFHCFAGIGRTTVFLVMCECIKHAKKMTLDEIIQRQVRAGGINLLEATNPEGSLYVHEEARKAFIYKFYDYCKNNSDDFTTPFAS